MEVGGTQCTGTYDLLCGYEKGTVQRPKQSRSSNTRNSSGHLIQKTSQIFDEVEKKFLKDTDTATETFALYATISEKNHIIQALKQRLMNQQLQLAFYLHKNLFNENILEFSSRCTPRIKDQSIELSLAMCNFMKDSNGTKKLCKLHEKLNEYDQKVSEILSKQEEIVKSACEDEQEPTNRGSNHSEIYRKIMTTTAEVKKELAELRSCSEQINCLEDEKNALVDFIFSLPETQDTIMKMEAPKQEEPTPQPKEDTTIATQPLKHLNRNASITDISLPEPSRPPKDLVLENKEMQILRKENEKLNSILETITEASNPFRVLELEAKCVKIERDLEEVRRGLELEVETKDEAIARLQEELKLASDQCVYFQEEMIDLRTSVNLVVEENELLQMALEKFNESKEGEGLEQLKEIIRNQKEQIKRLVLLICNLEDDSILDGDFKLSISSRNCEDVEDSGLFSAKTEYPLEETEVETEVEPKSKVDLNAGNEYIESVPSKSSFHSKQTFHNSTNYITSSKIMKDCCQMVDMRQDKMTTTSLEVESFDQNGKKESLRATLESTTNLGGVLEMENSSNLRLRLHCFSGTNSVTSTGSKENSKIRPNSPSYESIPTKLEPNEQVEPSCQGVVEGPVNQERVYSQKITRGKQAIVNNIKRIYSHILGQKD